MKNAFLRKIISAGVVMSTLGTLAPLGVSAQWKQSNDNTWSYLDCNRAVTGWKNISGNWYCFDSNGKMKIGWIYDNGTWYYNTNSGAMQTGWVNVNGTWYYMDANGSMKTGWIYSNGLWYYADSTGAMQTGVVKVNGKTYYLNNSGAMQVGNVKIGNETYTFARNGQAIGNIPTANKEFDSNNKLIKTNNTSTNSNSNSNSTTNNISVSTGGSKTITENTKEDTKITNNTSTTTSTSNSTGSNTNNNASVAVSGLPAISQKYSVTIQDSAEQTILKLMNQKRVEAGLQPLTMDNTLLSVARYKSDHMIQNNYFDHTNPDGTKWTTWLKALGYNYTATAENIAYNSYDPVELFNQWWNSSGHRQNMMNPSYTKVGVGVLYGNGKYMGTQEFSN